MRIIFLLILISAIVISCSSNKEEAESTERPSWSSADTIIIWSVDAEQFTRKRIFIPEDSINIPEPLMNGINNLWPEAGVYTKGKRNDTLIVGLRNEIWLTDQIGSDGAEAFLSFAALNLLELKGVNHIFFDVQPGVHAGADTWEERDFTDWKEVN